MAVKGKKCALLVNVHVTEIFVNCGLWNAHSVIKDEIIRAFKSLIVIRLAIKNMCVNTQNSSLLLCLAHRSTG